MKTTVNGARVSITFSDDADITRKCGGCTLCCRLVPVNELHKLAGEKCRHARFSQGCAIYAKRPRACHDWSCRWLVDEQVASTKIRRPDRSHYVIDLMPDFIEVEEGGRRVAVQVIQVWNDPGYPDAHRDPALRSYLADMGEKYNMATLVRFKPGKALVLVPPCMMRNGQWCEQGTEVGEGVGMWSGRA